MQKKKIDILFRFRILFYGNVCQKEKKKTMGFLKIQQTNNIILSIALICRASFFFSSS